jgi:hypothetical protein
MTKELINRIKYRYKEYYITKSKAKTHANAMKMASNWSHEYPTGTSRAYIADQIVECWKRQENKDD